MTASFTSFAQTTTIVDVISTTTGATWMDRNLGATQQATSIDDALAYGHLYQWGRGNDDHQLRTNTTTSPTLAMSNTPGNLFITSQNRPYDWLATPDNNLWQGANGGVNNPCPTGYRVPTSAELQAEQFLNAAGAFGSILKLTLAGYRYNQDGIIYSEGAQSGRYWTSTNTSQSNLSQANTLYFINNNSSASFPDRVSSYGLSVRCIKDAATVLSTEDLLTSTLNIYKTSNNNLRITGLQEGPATVKMYSVLGKEVMSSSFQVKTVNDIAIPNHLAKGIYIVQLVTNEVKQSIKIIIE